MKIFHTRAALSDYLNTSKNNHLSVGLVPTMGALHNGHISLIDIAKQQTDVVVCSIFVNPTQFTDPKDLDNYPRPVEADISKLENANCDVLFMPSVSEMYQNNEKWNLDLSNLDDRLEGKFRPGHYQGVTQIVFKLFDTVKPDKAFFGQKDFQQFLVIQTMVQILKLDVELIMCPIIRENDGLAMSSRNIHLSAEEHKTALVLSKVLKHAQLDFDKKNIADLKQSATDQLNSVQGIDLEYFEICDAGDLNPVSDKSPGSIIALVAAKVGRIRLIDNIILK
ncbi:MAG: pantoate--beta-alanine ligase [Daejeonella sp.]